MSQPQNAPTARYDAYNADPQDRRCAVCIFNGPTAILPKLTRAERDNMPMPGDPDCCSSCGMRRVNGGD